MLKKVSRKNSLKGLITIPSDKSISHRAVMFSSIAEGECIVSNFSSGADCHSTLNLFKNLGTDIQFVDDKTLKIKSTGILQPTKENLDYAACAQAIFQNVGGQGESQACDALCDAAAACDGG